MPLAGDWMMWRDFAVRSAGFPASGLDVFGPGDESERLSRTAGDPRFQRRSREEMFEKRADRSLILASHIPEIIRSHCSRAIVLYRGRAKLFDDLELAINFRHGVAVLTSGRNCSIRFFPMPRTPRRSSTLSNLPWLFR